MAEPAVLQLAEVFGRTVSNERDVIKQAEEQLKAVSQQPGYGITVLKVIAAGDALGLDVRLAAAVNFKNLIKYRWVPSEQAQYAGAQAIPDDEKAQIKSLLTGLMLSTPPLVRAQLSEALTIISNHDFPKAWPTLLPELVDRLNSNDLATINGVCQTANSIFKRYRNQFSSNELVNELEGTQNVFAPAALETMQKLTSMVAATEADTGALRLLLSSVRLLCRIFYSLNFPGLTPLFESQLDAWMGAFHTFLVYDAPALAESDPSKESILDGVKAAICQCINLFMEANEEEFAKFLQTFVTDVWSLLIKVSLNSGQDNLAMSAISFLTGVSRSVHAPLFKDPQVLKQICEAIIIPNLRVRDEDEEVFDMNPIEYIRRDAEGSDSDTRRRAAADLVKSLTERFEAEVSTLCTTYISAMLQEYAANPSANWKSKDCAVYLVMALTVKGRTTERGATTTNRLVNISDFFTQQVLPELQGSQINEQPILKADALKFVTTFRSQLPKETTLSLLPALIKLLSSEHCVVHSYSATAVERFLALREGGQPRFTTADLAPYAQPLLEALFAAFRHPDSNENEYLMKAVMRLIGFLGPSIAPVAPTCLQALTGMLLEACKNPKSPGFNHYLFEAVAALVKHGVAANPGSLGAIEAQLFGPFELVLQQDVQEFHPYVFQIFAQLIELSPQPINPVYMGLFAGLLSPLFWERSGNVPALTRLLTAYLTKAGDQVVAGHHLTGVLGVFQKLIASKAHDHDGFAVLGAVVQSLPLDAYKQYLPEVWKLLFTRLQTTRTPKFVRGFVAFVSLLVVKAGPVAAQESMDAVQPGIFLMIMGQVYMPNMSPTEDPEDDKLVAVATTKCLTECPALFQNRELWGQLKEALNKKLQGPDASGDGQAADDAGEGLDEEAPGGMYSAAYARLAHAAQPERPVLAEIADPKQFAEASLARFAGQHGIAA